MSNLPEEKCPVKSGQKPPRRPKPMMRGMHLKNSLNNLYAALIFSGTCTLLFYAFNNVRRQNIYADFHSLYNAEKSFNRMQEAGLFKSAPPGAKP